MERTAKDFVALVGGALADAERRGVHVTAGACDLEVRQLARSEEESPPVVAGPDHLEGRPRPLDPGRADGTSRLCYFLDGVQSSREIGRIGAAPVVVATVAAAVVNRCEKRFSRMDLEGPPVAVRAVILPRRAGDEVGVFWDLLVDAGLSRLGPEEAPALPDLVLDSTEYTDELDPSDYVGMLERAGGQVRRLRERLEGELLRRWEGDDRVLSDEKDWIAVDGQLRDTRETNRRAVGLIKSVTRPEFVGGDVRMLLDLEPGMRTTSFIPAWQLRRDPSGRRASWYMRMWPPQPGADALGSLMRVEAHRETTPEKADEITRWILAERAPLAKPDSRWPAMIYPIHHVEKLLKPLVQGSERELSRLERQLAKSSGRN